MRILTIVLIWLAFGPATLSAQVETDSIGPRIEFEARHHEFPRIKRGGNVQHRFKFTNTGDAPLVITAAKSSCGCDVATASREPILPGETGEIHYKYDSKRLGPINKSVTVVSNAVNAPRIVLRVSGEIYGTPIAKDIPVEY